MRPDDIRYPVGSYISVNGVTVGKITSVSEYEVTVVYKNGVSEKVFWHMVYPINLSPEIMQDLGFKEDSKKEQELHIEYVYSIQINGRVYKCKGFLVDKKYMWNFQSMTVRYLHHMQMLLWIVDPKKEFRLS